MADERQAIGDGVIGGKELGVSNNGSGGEEVRGTESEVRKMQGHVVRWDRFLPFRSLKVLLVENDDCTRHVVSALLKNCSYEVVAVANGVQAWRYLEDLTNHVDLILSEVVMPVISGIGLLYKIMNHKSFKNIPVIMMSSHDSMGIVFKCLSRGAVDFLVKPIRKNELKNLWQHVWRRCQSSSGSDIESGTESRKSVRTTGHDIPVNSIHSQGNEYGRNDSSSDDDDDDDDESGAQSSWTKRAAEIGSLQPTENEMNDAPDSTCAQVIHTKAGLVSNEMENINVAEESEELQEQNGACKVRLLKQGTLQQIMPGNLTKGKINLSELNLARKQKVEYDQFNKENKQAERLITAIASSNKQLEGNTIETSNVVADFSYIDGVKLGTTELPVLECRSEKERYNCGPSLFQDSQNDGSVVLEAKHNTPSHFSSGFIENNSEKTTQKQELSIYALEISESQEEGQQGKNNCTVQPLNIDKTDGVAVEIQVQPKESQQVHVEHHHHYHHYHHHIHDVQHHTTLTNQDQASFENPETVEVPCASSHAFTETGVGAAGNFSLNGSGSGSQYGSNGKDGSQHGSNVQDVVANTNNDGDVAGSNATDNVNMNITTNVSDEDHISPREADLIKFRQKRKERSFEKKVKNQGRKKVADQWTCE